MQTSINTIGQPAAFAGLPADTGISDKVSGFSEEATASIPFGAGVVQGTALEGALLPSGSGDKLKGVAVFSFEHAPDSAFGDLSATGLVPKAKLGIMRKGRIWIIIDQSITSIAPFSDRGYCRYSANSPNNTLGAWSNASDSGKNLDATKQAVFTSGVVVAADGTKIAQVEVDFTNAP